MFLLENYTYNYFVADFETVVEETNYFKQNNRTRVLYGVVAKLDGTYKQSFIDVDEMFACLLQNYKYKTMIIYFHNLSFDGVFLLDFLARNGFVVVDKVEKDLQMSVFRTTGSKIYHIKVKYNGVEFHFRCSKLLLSTSVKALGKCVNLDKYVSDSQETEEFYQVEPEATVEEFEEKNKDYCLYCERDVEIVRLSLIDFYISIFKFLSDFQAPEETYRQVLNASTISQLSFILQKMCALKDGMTEFDLSITHAEERDIMDKFTNGGLTVSNEEYRGLQVDDANGYVIDLKSAYPAVMSGLIPYGPALEKPPRGPYCTFQEIFYETITPKNHSIPLLKNWEAHKVNDPNYFLKATNYKTYLLKEERELLEQLFDYGGRKIIKEYYYPLKNYLKEFIDYGFKMKELMKQQNKMASSHTYKILLNSAYGIHAKRMDFRLVKPYVGEKYEVSGKEYVLNDNIDLNKPDSHSWIPNNEIYAYNFNEWIDISKFRVAHKGIANYITAMTRCKLLKGIIHFKPKNFLYCDTDSLFIMNHTKEDLEKFCGPNLGDWELEDKQFDTAIVMRSKTYQLYKNNEVVKQGLAGVRKEKINLKEVRHMKLLEILNATKVACRVDGGLVLRGVDKMLNFAFERDLEYHGKTKI